MMSNISELLLDGFKATHRGFEFEFGPCTMNGNSITTMIINITVVRTDVQKLRVWMAEGALSQEVAAILLGCSQSALSKWLNSKRRIPQRTMHKLEELQNQDTPSLRHANGPG